MYKSADIHYISLDLSSGSETIVSLCMYMCECWRRGGRLRRLGKSYGGAPVNVVIVLVTMAWITCIAEICYLHNFVENKILPNTKSHLTLASHTYTKILCRFH